jgi:hypothetical protein
MTRPGTNLDLMSTAGDLLVEPLPVAGTLTRPWVVIAAINTPNSTTGANVDTLILVFMVRPSQVIFIDRLNRRFT